MLTVPTSAEIRLARASVARRWLPAMDAVSGPALAALGIGATILRTVTRPLTSVAGPIGLEPVAEVLDSTTPPSRDSQSEGELLLEPTQAAPPTASGWPSGGAPVQLRAGIYPELAWRGWQLLQALRAQPRVESILAEVTATVSLWVRAMEVLADALHDATEDLAGQVTNPIYRPGRKLPRP